MKATLANNDLHGLRVSLAGRLHYLCLKMVDVYVAISQDLEKEFLSAGLRRQKVHLMANGVDTNRFYPVENTAEKRALRQELGLPTGRPIVLSVGVFDKRKNIGWLIDEWVTHGGFESHAYLLAIGPQSREDLNGDFLGSLKALGNDHSDLLGIMDHVDNIEQYYRAADFFVLPSHSEGMPNVILEAMASGLPCIATDISGSRELVTDGETGYLFPPGNSEGLTQAVNKLLTNLNNEMSHQARRIVEKKYSIDALALNYEHLYMDLLKKDIKRNTDREIEG